VSDLGSSSSSGGDEHQRGNEESPVREILQPTFENMRRMQLKNRRRDVDGSIVNSSILEFIKPQVEAQRQAE
jgi:hypothetical protein